MIEIVAKLNRTFKILFLAELFPKFELPPSL